MVKPMRWGFVGASNIAERVIPSLRKVAGQEPVAVCSRNAERARQFATAMGLQASYTELGSFLREGRFDAVYVSSTNELHCEQTLAALAAGCHVMCEKPLAMNRADAARMNDAARHAGRVLATNHHLRAQAAHRMVRDIVASGALGHVHGVQVSHAVFLPPHLQGWRLDAPGAGGGVVLDILVHNADLLRFLLGREPRRIHTVAQRNGLAQGALEDGAMSVIEFDGGTLAQTHESFVAQHALTRLHVLGTQGSLYAVGSLTQAGTAQLWQRDAQGERELSVPPVDLYETGFRAFAEACAGQGAPLASGVDGARAMAVALAGLTSAASGRMETIPD
ncbi:MAG: Gfo/Idh/MocA family oxidoreductase [Piscinibacter sp.]|nr:Gfo/Idh/MocA family oxidoreductase [Piscinibacter sp.]